jgi:hypothetical protein
VADLLPWARRHLPQGEPALFYPATVAIERIRAELAEGGPWRVVGEDFLAYPDLLPAYGLAEVRPHNPVAPAGEIAALAAAFDFAPTRARYFAPFRRPDQPFLDFLNVRVVVSNAYQPEPVGLERIDSGEWEPFRLWRNPDALPRWFLASGVEAVPREKLAAWIAELADPRRVGIGPGEVGSLEPAGPPATAAAVRAVAQAPGRATLELPLAEPPGTSDRLLATSLPGPWGWRARASPGGEPLHALGLNGAFLGVAVPASVARLELRFRPPGLGAGLLLAACALAALAACLLLPRGAAGSFAGGRSRWPRRGVPRPSLPPAIRLRGDGPRLRLNPLDQSQAALDAEPGVAGLPEAAGAHGGELAAQGLGPARRPLAHPFEPGLQGLDLQPRSGEEG